MRPGNVDYLAWIHRCGEVPGVGDRDFNAGNVGAISREIQDRGPILYSDVGSGGQRDIIVTHIGADLEQGWLAFAARRAEDPRDCYFDWDATTEEFSLTTAVGSSTTCDEVTTDAAGTGLFQFANRVEVRDGNIHVLLNEDPE